MRRFSIIMPTFDRPHLITRAVGSILRQDHADWELIIQNGGKRKLGGILPEDPRIVLVEEPDGGITDAMNRGMRRATGDVFCWANDDDEMNQDTLSFVDGNLDGLWGYGIIEMTDGTRSLTWGDVGPDATFGRLARGNFVPQPAVFWTRDMYRMAGDMDGSEDLTSDYEYWLRMWSIAEPQKWDRLMATYHLHPGQITQTRTREQMEQARRTAEKYAKKPK